MLGNLVSQTAHSQASGFEHYKQDQSESCEQYRNHGLQWSQGELDAVQWTNCRHGGCEMLVHRFYQPERCQRNPAPNPDW